ncbi:MAG: cation:proton antiporter [Microgenomates group bacterium]
MPDYSLLLNLGLVLGSACFGGLLAKKTKQPIMLGYLLAGLFVSLTVARLNLKKDWLHFLSEIGLVFLMFSLGLEFSFQQIERFKKTILFGAVGQIILTILSGSLVLHFFGFNLTSSLIMAGAFSLSSTAIVVKVLQEKGELETLAGEIMFGWLLVQDLAVLPLILLLPALSLSFSFENFVPVFFQIAKAGLILVFSWFCARQILPLLIDFVTRFKSRELLLLFVITTIFLFTVLVALSGLSFAFGAFLIGLVLSQIPSRLAIFSETRPLKDVFLAIFFVSLGLSLNPAFLVFNWEKIVLVCLAFALLKIFLSGVLLVFFNHQAKTILEASFGLAGVGEFSFVFALAAMERGLLSPQDYSLIVSVTLISMVAAPFLFGLADKIYLHLRQKTAKSSSFYRRFFGKPLDRPELQDFSFEQVVILGYGRVGRWVGRLLDKVKIPYLVIEYNPQIVRQLRLEGKKVIFGDPSDFNVLDFAQLNKARLVVLAIPDVLTQKMAIVNCRQLNPEVKIICRSHREEDWEELKLLGADCIIQPEFEGALSISHRVLQGMGFGKEEINAKLKEIKKEHEDDVYL